MVGAGSFGTAVALLLVRAGIRTTLLCRTPEQAERLSRERENTAYLSVVQTLRYATYDPTATRLGDAKRALDNAMKLQPDLGDAWFADFGPRALALLAGAGKPSPSVA